MVTVTIIAGIISVSTPIAAVTITTTISGITIIVVLW